MATTRVLAAALKTLEFDLAFAGVDTSDGVAGVVPAGVAALAGLPYLSYAATIEPDMAARTVRVHRITATGFDVLEAPMPALIIGTQALGEPRYPSLKGIMAARSKEISTLTLADLGIDPASVGTAGATTRVVGLAQAAAAGRDAGHPRTGRRGRSPGRRLPRRTAADLMAGGIWVHGEVAGDGSLAKLSTEVATLARALAEASGEPVTGVVIGADPAGAAASWPTSSRASWPWPSPQPPVTRPARSWPSAWRPSSPSTSRASS